MMSWTDSAEQPLVRPRIMQRGKIRATLGDVLESPDTSVDPVGLSHCNASFC